MRVKSKFSIYILNSGWFAVSLLFGLLFPEPLHAQSGTKPEINFAAENEKLSLVLYRLSNETNMNFTYNSAEDVFGENITYNAISKQPLVILDELLLKTNYTYKLVGNQIVIYKKKLTDSNLEPANNVVISDNTADDKQNTFRIITDTIFVKDTTLIIQTDTIRITDTVFIVKEKEKKPTISKIKEIPSDFFNPTASREKGWSASLFVAPILSNFSLAQEEGSLSFRNFSFGVEVSEIINKLNISGGIKLTQFAEKFNHSYSIDKGGFFAVDTIDTYYTIVQNDTAWYYITDSTWKPLDSHEYSYNVSNRVGYIEFTASVSYDYVVNRKFRLYLKAGAQAGILVYKNGLAIPNENEPVGVDFADLNFRSSSYSFLVGIGIKYRINKQLDFNSEIYYLKYLTNMVDNYPINNKIQGVGVKFGLIYYF